MSWFCDVIQYIHRDCAYDYHRSVMLTLWTLHDTWVVVQLRLRTSHREKYQAQHHREMFPDAKRVLPSLHMASNMIDSCCNTLSSVLCSPPVYRNLHCFALASVSDDSASSAVKVWKNYF
jgi:hypothetical protein